MLETQRRTKTIIVKLTPDEHAELMAEVRAHDISASQIVRAGIKHVLRIRRREREMYPEYSK